jgi:ribosome modulation factor
MRGRKKGKETATTNGASAPPPETPPPPDDPPIDSSRLERLRLLVDELDAAQARRKTAQAAVGNIFKRIEDDGNHKKALKFALLVRDMDSGPRRDFLTSWMRYCEEFGIWAQGELFDPMPRPPAPPPASAAEAASLAQATLPLADPLGIGANAAAATVARAMGRNDGLAATRDSAHLYPQDSPHHSDYEEAWQTAAREQQPKAPPAPGETAPTTAVETHREDGYQAAMQGHPATHNPWPPSTKAHSTWYMGWVEGDTERKRIERNLTAGPAPKTGRRRPVIRPAI